MKNKKYQLENINIETRNTQKIEQQGKQIMDELDNQNIKTAEFNDGTYYKKMKNHRTLVTKNTMITETSDEVIIRYRKSSSDSNKLIVSPSPKQTQKIFGAYNGVSQGHISKKSK